MVQSQLKGWRLKAPTVHTWCSFNHKVGACQPQLFIPGAVSTKRFVPANHNYSYLVQSQPKDWWLPIPTVDTWCRLN